MGLVANVAWITSCAQLGYLLRWALGVLLGDRCGRWSWAACVTNDGTGSPGGAVFTDLPANALGCFVVGFIASSKALDLQDGRNVAILPPQHWLQGAHALQTGMRTGFCGCLTTFASWMTQVSVMVYGASSTKDGAPPDAVYRDWPGGFGALIIGTMTVSAGINAGRFAARQRAVTNPGTLDPETDEHSADGRGSAHSARASAASAQAQNGCQGEDDHETGGAQEGGGLAPRGVVVDGADNEEGATQDEEALPADDFNGDTAAKLAEADQGAGAQSAAHRTPDAKHDSRRSVGNVRTARHGKDRAWPPASPVQLANWAAGIAGTLLYALAIGMTVRAYRVSDFDSTELWLGMLLAPPFALLRWRLTMLNAVPSRQSWSHFSWLPLGTFTANMLACAVDFVLLAIIIGAAIPKNVLRASLLAIKAGGMGSLSTVSTWAAEVAALAGDQLKFNAFKCILVSIIGAQLLGLVIYAWAPWTQLQDYS